ncbi:methyl farnesoate epoxidase isoform X1 [Nilaparvata lugens]|uniref:methyl farnesoate epoxidase isoform X1 n=1 Tax=Nilaparvata lugens TaxID=108931 RepID=UPI00193D62D6|nr:methyl farnesoate epoxidase isoform X1 [Nilaparvata lugens]
MWLEIAAVATIIVWYFYFWDIKPRHFPPGPKWLPFVGNLFEFLQLHKKLKYVHLVWQHWAETYGPIVGVKLGLDTIVVISDYKLASELLALNEYEGRPDGFLFRLRAFGKRLGVVFTDGPFGLEQRKFCLKQLKLNGFGKSSMEDLIGQEVSEFSAYLASKCGKGLQDIYHTINVHVMNVLWSMIAGKRFSHTDEKLTLLLEQIHTSFCLQDMSGGVLNQVPIYRFFGAGKQIFNKHKHVVSLLNSFLKETIDEHRINLDPENINDVIDAYLLEIQQRNSENDFSFTEDQLIVTLMDLFMAGSDSTTNTISFLVEMLTQHPDVQQRAQNEIDSVCRGRDVCLADRKQLDYVEAVIMEVQRFCNVAPLTIPHRTKEKVKLDKYIIPKDTTVLVNLYSIHMDNKYWQDPETFRPERFLDSEGRVKFVDRLIPFGMGRRRCLGETLGRASVFKFVTAILKNFNLTAADTIAKKFSPIDGAILFPSPFTVQITPRMPVS